MTDDEWSDEIPDTVGFYWFFGDPYHGQMGRDFSDDAPPIDKRMYLIKIFKVSNGMMATTDGTFIPLCKFDKSVSKTGCVGYWKPAILPEFDVEKFDSKKYF